MDFGQGVWLMFLLVTLPSLACSAHLPLVRQGEQHAAFRLLLLHRSPLCPDRSDRAEYLSDKA